MNRIRSDVDHLLTGLQTLTGWNLPVLIVGMRGTTLLLDWELS